MTKVDFLIRLEKGLASVSQEDRDAALEYYREYFDDAGADHEQDVITELGSPEKLASDIKGETPTDLNNTSNNHSSPSHSQANTYDLPGGYVPPRSRSYNNNHQKTAYPKSQENMAIRILKIFLLVIAAPVVFGLAIAGAVVLLIPFILAVAFGFASTAMVFCALTLFSVSFANGLFVLGIALLLVAITVACVFGGVKLFTFGAKPLVGKCADVYYRYFVSKRRAQQ